MNPATDDSLSWLVSLGLTTIEQRGDGSALVRSATGSSAAPSVEVALSRVLSLDVDAPDLRAFVERAQTGGDANAIVAGRRVAGRLREGELEIAVGGAPDLLSSAVAHELANALTGIAGWARLARMGKAPLPQRTSEALETLESAASDALDTARSMLAVLRGRRAEVASDSARIISAVIDSLTPLALERGVTLRSDVRTKIVGIGSVELRSVVSNLVKNAIEATRSGGEVLVSSKAKRGMVEIAVVDDGPGMDEETIARAFDTGFTTKATGSGVGLPLVRTLVQSAGGNLVVESEPGRGTRMAVAIPAQADNAQGSSRSGVHVRQASRATRVLFVDDDSALREMVRTALELHNVEVTLATGLLEARKLEGTWDLAIVDLGLSDGRGDLLAAELRRAGRAGRVVLTSGGVTAAPPEVDVLPKPFTLDDLQDLVRRSAPTRRERSRTKRLKGATR